jgi:hypothetical protein
MSKKNKKQTRATREAPTSTWSSRQAVSRTDEAFNPDYSYVKKDLKRIGILAGTFLVIMVILSFFLQ